MTGTTADRPLDALPRRVSGFSDDDLYRRGAATLLGSWEQYARGATGAAVHSFAGVAAAVFPNEPERVLYNNALLARDLDRVERADALDAMEAAYAAVGVTRFAAWVHESDEAMRSDLRRRGYTLDETTRAMGIALDELPLPRPELQVGSADLVEHLRLAGMPDGFLAAADPASFHVLIARAGAENAATTMAYDLCGDCGIYNVGTVERARRRGLATALTALHLHDARVRRCQTASLQSSPMAERIYTAAGFRDLGRILEYAPPPRRNGP